MKIDEMKLSQNMKELGHPEHLLGTEYLRTAVREYRPGIGMTKELYPAIARAHDTTPSRVERAMRHSIQNAWSRGSMDSQLRMFGYTINPNSGVPTVGEWCATMARLCREAEGQEPVHHENRVLD